MISYDTSFEIKGKHVTKVKDGVWKFVQDEESFGGPEVLEPNTKPVDYKDLYEEGPFFYERDGKYYLMYAAGGVPEHIAYSMSKKPTGPWKYMGQVMRLQVILSVLRTLGAGPTMPAWQSSRVMTTSCSIVADCLVAVVSTVL